MYTTGNTTNSVLSLSPKLMKELAEYAVKEHRAGRCLTQEQVEKSVMETMGWLFLIALFRWLMQN